MCNTIWKTRGEKINTKHTLHSREKIAVTTYYMPSIWYMYPPSKLYINLTTNISFLLPIFETTKSI